ncbi:MAG: transcriptional regulator [Enterococcus cecorum]|uniref:winged helix-turn-helix transcriptional regulator n=1 Tax=Enterococcus cecorum TaxID=44008 RepID=UPI000DE90791|nr:transcriptional regulator [Enterococcus cecorum]
MVVASNLNNTEFEIESYLLSLLGDALVYRHDYQTVPPSVTYHLTDLGNDLVGTMGELFDFWKKHMESQKSKV